MTTDNFQGVRKLNNQVEFCVYSPKAQKVELCLFSQDEQTEKRVEMAKDEEDIWHAILDNIEDGQKYGYRTHGKYNPNENCFFNPNKLLVDPYAIEVTRSLHDINDNEKYILLSENDLDSSSVAPKSVVRFLDKETLEKKYPYLYQKPHTKWQDTHIYELHVNNFSAQNENIAKEKRGKIAALSDMVDYFKDLSYTQVELMPLTPTMADWQLQQKKGLCDQWGYNPINHHAIDPRYGNIYDFLEFVNTMHKHGMEVGMAGGENPKKINIFTKHDGATQYDWATYHEKNNYENNENNCDGTNDNHYSPSANDDIRLIKTKTAHALNTLARGVPLSLSGDELWHTQRGNNNGYAKRFPIKWKDLSDKQKERYLFERKLNAFRQNHPIFSSIEAASSQIMPNGKPSWEWINIYGNIMQQKDWDFTYNRFLGYVLNGQNKEGQRFDDDFLIMVSGNDNSSMEVKLPPTPHKGSWQLVFDTAKNTSYTDNTEYKQGSLYQIQPHSVVIMTCKRNNFHSNTLKRFKYFDKFEH